MAVAPEFKRVLFGLHQSGLDRKTIAVAAELAELLRIDFLGMFIEEPDVTTLAGLPFVREFRTLARAWHPIEVEQLTREIELTASAARRLFAEATATARVACRFEIVKGTSAHAIQAFSQSTDIVVVAEPKSAADRVAGAFPGLAAAALRSDAAVLILPRRLDRPHGPVVALAAGPDDPCVEAAISIASAAQGGVTVLAAYEGAAAKRDARAATAVEYVPVPRSGLANERSISSVLGRIGERLIVVTRGSFGSANEAMLMSLASLRGAPVLIVEPASKSGT